MSTATKSLPTRRARRLEAIHDVWSDGELKVLEAAGVLSISKSSRLASLDRDATGEKIAVYLHEHAQVTDDEEFYNNGVSVASLATAICGMDDPAFTDEGKIELLARVNGLMQPKPSGPVQGALGLMHPRAWMIRRYRPISGTDNSGAPMMNPKVPIYGVTTENDLILRYDITGRRLKARSAATSRKSYDKGLIDRVPSIAAATIAAARWNAESFASEALSLQRTVLEGMDPEEARQLEAAVDAQVDEYREQERLAIESAVKATTETPTAD